MPRVEFDGIGEPIPTIALPPFGTGNLPPTVLTFTDDTDFSVTLYQDLGFTHFEAWCVGAAGGRGSDASSQPRFVVEEIYRPVPQDWWDFNLESIRIQDYFTAGNVWDKPYVGWNPADPTEWATAPQIEERRNPGHYLRFRTYRQVLAEPSLLGMGGGGGGGGLHKVSGLLESLPETVPIIVGQAGSDSPYGQIHQNSMWTPLMSDDVARYHLFDPSSVPWPRSRLFELTNYFTDYLNSYPIPHSILPPPLPGADGGYSSFGNVGKASGGKGGYPGMIWNGSQFVIKGDGGAGGIGGRIESGGGGAGSVAENVNGTDGIWHPETGIGAGGGGGKGGRPSEIVGDPNLGPQVTINHLATAGGQGSYSFADTSVYGARQFRQPWTYLKPVDGFSASSFPGQFGPTAVTLPNGTVTYVPTTNPYLAIPGGGGGARPIKNLKVGSRAPGYSPNGVVVLRLTRIT